MSPHVLLAAVALTTQVAATQVDDRDRELWRTHVRKYLQGPLWRSDTAYDAAAVLMVPIHAAYQFGEAAWQNDLRDFYQRAVAARREWPSTALYRLQFLFAASRAVVAAKKAGKLDRLPARLPDILMDEVVDYWERKPAWQWDRPDFDSMRERVQWKLAQKSPKRTYYRAIVDDELFVFAIAADMAAYLDAAGRDDRRRRTLDDVLEVANQVFRDRGKNTADGGWIFDPGVWTDEPDHAYAGVRSKEGARSAKTVPNLARDASHAHRWPVVLRALIGASSGARKVAYRAMLDGLQRQFLHKVLVPPSRDFPAYRLNNYMDGGNGLFGYDPGTRKGYGPGELSGTLTLGWWSAAGGEKVQEAYRQIAKSFPLPPTVIRLYASSLYPGDPAAKTPDSYVGLRPLICSLASKLDWSK